MTKETNYWRKTKSGMRISTTLIIGAIFSITSAILQLGLPYIFTYDSSMGNSLITGFWVLWIISLWILGIAFVWLGNMPFLGRFGTLVGVFHLIQGFHLLILLFANTGSMVPPIAFTVGRLMSLLMFGIIERKNIGVPLSIMFWVSSLLQLLKIFLRIMETLPDMSQDVQILVDSFLLVLVCVAIIQLARLLRGLENSWAEAKFLASNSGFSDFNNPEHKWDE